MNRETTRSAVMVVLAVTIAAVCQGAGEDAAKPERLRRLREAGYTFEHCTLRGVPISAGWGTVGEEPAYYPRSVFPYDWSFDDHGLCGMTGSRGVTNLAAGGGLLRFDTTGEANLNWGDIVPSDRPLDWGYPDQDGYEAPLWYGVEVRLRQSLPEATWWANGKYGAKRGPVIGEGKRTAVKGAEWQTVFLECPQPQTGFQLCTDKAGNRVEIDAIRPVMNALTVAARRTLELPARVRWAKVSFNGNDIVTVFVNGKPAAKTPPQGQSFAATLWDFDLDPRLFRVGRNVIVVETAQICGSSQFLLDGALLCEDGSYVRLDSDAVSWKRPPKVLKSEVGRWRETDFDDGRWVRALAVAEHTGRTNQTPEEAFYETFDHARFYFNPSWKGQVMVAPADGRPQPVFSGKEPVSLRAAVPFRAGKTQSLNYIVYDEMGDGYVPRDAEVRRGEVRLSRAGLDHAGELRLAGGVLPANRAYAVVLRFAEDGRDIETCRYEIAVCGLVEQPVARSATNYTDGMDLKLVWETDAAADQKAGEFISCGGDSVERPSAVIQTPLGRFRTTYPEKVYKSAGGSFCNYMSFRYRLAHPGRPHVILADYPEDTRRLQAMVVNDNFIWQNPMTIASDAAALGVTAPLSHALRQHHAVFFPNDAEGTVTFFSLGGQNYYDPSRAARVGRIRIYEILNDVPRREIADAPGEKKWFGQRAEAGPRIVVTSCFSSPAADYFKSMCYLVNNSPYFYRNWMVTCVNLIKRMRFAGENAYFSGQNMYGAVLYPSQYSESSAFDYGRTPGTMRDYGVLMSRMFDENELGWFSCHEIVSLPRVKMTCGDLAVAEGAETRAAVTKEGQQQLFLGRSVWPNWVHPRCREIFNDMMDELIALYGREKGWKGIDLQIDEGNGPSWLSDGTDPYWVGYDDYTADLFQKETGVTIPVDRRDPKRFAKRYDWLMANAGAKEKWTQWRAAKMTELYDGVAKRLKRARPDLRLVVSGAFSSCLPDPAAEPSDERAPLAGLMAAGFDYAHVRAAAGMVGAFNVPAAPRASSLFVENQDDFDDSHARALDTAFLAAMADDGKNGISFRQGWYEIQPTCPDRWVWPKQGSQLPAMAWPYSPGPYLAEGWVNIFLRSNPTLIEHPLQDVHMWGGREDAVARFAGAFRMLPVCRYRRLTGNGLDANVWVAAGRYGRDAYGYVANPGWWELAIELTSAAKRDVTDLITGGTSSGLWALNLAPYEIRTFRVANARPEELFASAKASVSEPGRRAVEDLIRENRKTFAEQEGVLASVPSLRTNLIAWLDGCAALAAQGRYLEAHERLVVSRYAPKARQLAWTLEGYTPRLAEIPRAKGPVVMDGESGDWAGATPIGMIADPKMVLTEFEPAQPYAGPADLSGKVFGCWDDTSLYLAFNVTDDQFFPRTFGGDSVETYLDMDLNSDCGEGKYTEDDFNFKAAGIPTTRDLELDIRQGKNGEKYPLADGGGVRGKWQKTDTGYWIEMAIPWRTLIGNKKPEAGLRFGFDVMLIDSDKDKKPAALRVMFWSSPKVPYYDPRTFGRAVLVPGR